jgi:cyclase
MQNGYDIQLIALLAKEVSIPIIANGGAAVPSDAVLAISNGADAVAAASIFHFTQYTPNSIKEALQKADIPVRF